jgi:hypothetical protein
MGLLALFVILSETKDPLLLLFLLQGILRSFLPQNDNPSVYRCSILIDLQFGYKRI